MVAPCYIIICYAFAITGRETHDGMRITQGAASLCPGLWGFALTGRTWAEHAAIPSFVGMAALVVIYILATACAEQWSAGLDGTSEQEEVDDSDGHHRHGTLLAYGIARHSHEQGEESAAKKSHDH